MTLTISYKQVRKACQRCIEDGREATCRFGCRARRRDSSCELGNKTGKVPTDFLPTDSLPDDFPNTFFIEAAMYFYKEYLDPMEILINEVEELDKK
jgi:hypothetical protein